MVPPSEGSGGATTLKVLEMPDTEPARAFNFRLSCASGTEISPAQTPLAKAPLNDGRTGSSLTVLKRMSAR